MSRRMFLLSLLVILLLPFSAAADDEVRAVFEQFRAALGDRKGPAARALLSVDSIRYYEQLRQSSVEANAAGLRALPPGEHLSVLWIRRNIPPSVLLSLSAEGLFEALVERGALGGPAAEQVSIGAIQSDGLTARGEYVQNGTVVPGSAHFFRREGKSWRIDIAPQARALNQQLLDALRQQQKTVERLFEETVGEELSEEEWRELRRPIRERLT